MKKRLLIGTLIIATVLLIILVTPVFAKRELISIKLVGKGTATNSEDSLKVKILMRLAVTQISEDTIGGVGICRMIIGNARPENMRFRVMDWTIDRNTNELEILGIVLTTGDHDTDNGEIFLTGTLVGIPGKPNKVTVDLSGTLTLGIMTMPLKAGISGTVSR